MAYIYEIMTPMMVDDELPLFFARVNEVIALLERHGVNTVEMTFGWAWPGDEQWQAMTVSVAGIMPRIKEREQKLNESFGENDVHVEMPALDTGVLFCHEADLHLRFNETNPLVRDVLASWEAAGLIHCARVDKQDVAWSEMRKQVLDEL